MRAIPDREFFVKILNNVELSEIINIYNRVNSGGKRVEAEEKTFATLVSFYPSTNDYIAKLFYIVHPQTELDSKKMEEPLGSREISRYQYLQRLRERNFGFKQFIRVFIQASNYHFNFSMPKSSLSFSVVESEKFQQAIMKQQKVEFLWNLTEKIITFIAGPDGILQKELYCDDFQFLPDITTLLPIYELLLLFPGLMKDENKIFITLLCLELFLSQYEPDGLFELTKNLRNKRKLDDCIREIDKYINIKIDKKELAKVLEKSNSLQDRYVLMFYWLIRKKEAKDFFLKEGGFQSKTINKNISPAKHHIIPYSFLKNIYPELQGSARKSTHVANNIGNLTYISNVLNADLGEKIIDLSIQDDDNLEAHFLNDEPIKEFLINIRNIAEGKNNLDAGKIKEEGFKSYCNARRELIANGFIEWIRELKEKSGSPTNIELQIPKFYYDDKTEVFLKNFENEEFREEVAKLDYFLKSRNLTKRYPKKHSAWISYYIKYEKKPHLAVKMIWDKSSNKLSLQFRCDHQGIIKLLKKDPQNFEQELRGKSVNYIKDGLEIDITTPEECKMIIELLEKYFTAST